MALELIPYLQQHYIGFGHSLLQFVKLYILYVLQVILVLENCLPGLVLHAPGLEATILLTWAKMAWYYVLEQRWLDIICFLYYIPGMSGCLMLLYTRYVRMSSAIICRLLYVIYIDRLYTFYHHPLMMSWSMPCRLLSLLLITTLEVSPAKWIHLCQVKPLLS